MNSDASAFVVSGYDGDKCVKRTVLYCSCWKGGSAVDLLCWKRNFISPDWYLRDYRPQREKRARVNSEGKIIRINNMKAQSLAIDTRDEACSPAERPMLFRLFRRRSRKKAQPTTRMSDSFGDLTSSRSMLHNTTVLLRRRCEATTVDDECSKCLR